MHFLNNNHVFKKLGNRKKNYSWNHKNLIKFVKLCEDTQNQLKLERRYCTLVVYNIWQTHSKNLCHRLKPVVCFIYRVDLSSKWGKKVLLCEKQFAWYKLF